MTSRPMQAEMAAPSPGSRRPGPGLRVLRGAALSERELFDMVYRQMRSLTAGRERDLDDLVQDAMEQAICSISSFEGRSKLSTWTFQICYRTLLKRRRWYSRWLKRFSLSVTGDLPELLDHEVNAHTRLEEAERANKLHAALKKLSEKKRVVVVLHDFEGLKSEEIVEVTGAKLGTVRSRLRDGRRELLDLLSDDASFGAEVSL